MTVLAFPIAARQRSIDIDRLLTVQRFRDWLPAHRQHWFDSLSDADQAQMARDFAKMQRGT